MLTACWPVPSVGRLVVPSGLVIKILNPCLISFPSSPHLDLDKKRERERGDRVSGRWDLLREKVVEMGMVVFLGCGIGK